MTLVRKAVICGLVFLVVILASGAGQHEGGAVPTTTIEIINVPVTLFRTESGAGDSAKKAVYKVYVQLSDGFTSKARDIALGSAVVNPLAAEKESGFMTVRISDWYSRDNNYTGTNWAAAAILISPKEVDDIFDIDVKAYKGSAGASATVTIDWKKLISKHTMVNLGGFVGISSEQGIENLRRLYGEKDASDGIIVNDNDPVYGIKGQKKRATGDAQYKDSNASFTYIYKISQFNKKNDY